MLFLILLGVGGIVFSFTWGDKQLAAKAQGVSKLLAERDAKQESILKLTQANTDEAESKTIATLLDRLLPTAKNQETLVVDIIYTATGEAGIPFNNIKTFSFSGSGAPDALSGTEPFKEIPGVYQYPFTLTIDNITYDTLLKLLREIETNGRIVHVDNVQISPDKQNKGLLASVNLSMKAFLKP